MNTAAQVDELIIGLKQKVASGEITLLGGTVYGQRAQVQAEPEPVAHDHQDEVQSMGQRELLRMPVVSERGKSQVL